MIRLRPAAPAVALAVLLLSGCFAVGPQPDEAIPPVLLDSDLDILEAQAGKGTDGFSVNVWASVVVERDEISADDLRDLFAIVVDNTNITNINAITIIAQSDELETSHGYENNVYIDLGPPAAELGLEDSSPNAAGSGSVKVLWDDVIAMLEATR